MRYPLTDLAWQPLHRNPAANRVASASRDGTVKVRASIAPPRHHATMPSSHRLVVSSLHRLISNAPLTSRDRGDRPRRQGLGDHRWQNKSLVMMTYLAPYSLRTAY